VIKDANMKVEWWYDDASYHLDKTRVFLARLTVRDEAPAQLVTDGGTYEFENEEEASMWLTDEEYSPLGILVEDLREQGLSVDPRLEALVLAPQGESNGPMVIVLESVEGSPARG
jgi:hypothetical protein